MGGYNNNVKLFTRYFLFLTKCVDGKLQSEMRIF